MLRTICLNKYCLNFFFIFVFIFVWKWITDFWFLPFGAENISSTAHHVWTHHILATNRASSSFKFNKHQNSIFNEHFYTMLPCAVGLTQMCYCLNTVSIGGSEKTMRRPKKTIQMQRLRMKTFRMCLPYSDVIIGFYSICLCSFTPAIFNQNTDDDSKCYQHYYYNSPPAMKKEREHYARIIYLFALFIKVISFSSSSVFSLRNQRVAVALESNLTRLHVHHSSLW